MFYQLAPRFSEINMEQLSPDCLSAGYFTKEELPELVALFDFPESIVSECLGDKDNYRNTIDVYEEFSFGIVNFVDAACLYATSDRVAFFLKRNLFLMITLRDVDGSTRAAFDQAIRRFKPDAVTLEKVIYALLEGAITKDTLALAQQEFEIGHLEEEISQGRASRQFSRQILERKKRLLILQNYYEQLIDVGESLQENENEIFDGDTFHYFVMFTAKATRLSNCVQRLGSELNELRDALQASLDYGLNSVMKIFTVITSIFLPLTLIVGWYGMNFTYMPELDWLYGYPFVIILSVVTVFLCLLYFKKKKLL